MQDYSYIYVPGMVLSNPGITTRSHTFVTTQKCFRPIPRTAYTYKKQNTTLIFRILSVSFCFCKICNNRILLQISKVKTVNIEH